MGAGIDVIVIGIADEENLDSIASEEELERRFGENDDEALRQHPDLDSPPICYLPKENQFGAAGGVALGYILFVGDRDGPPQRLHDRLFKRIPELKARFLAEMSRQKLPVEEQHIGVYSLNHYDT